MKVELGMESSVIKRFVDIVPCQKEEESEISQIILEEKILQGGNPKTNVNEEYLHLEVFERILHIVKSRPKPQYKTLTEMRGSSDDVIERYENDEYSALYRMEIDEDEEMLDLTGKKEGEGYYFCHSHHLPNIITQACMLAHIAHIYGYNASAEGLARTLIMFRSLLAKECSRKRVAYLLKTRMYSIIGRATRVIFENHFPEISQLDLLHTVQLGEEGRFSNDLGEEIITAIRREIAYVKRLEFEGISERRVFSGF